MTDLLKRKGFVRVSGLLVKEEPELILQSMTGFLIVKAEHNFMTDNIEYLGYHADFECIERYEQALEYQCIIGKIIDEDTLEVTHTFKWEKVI